MKKRLFLSLAAFASLALTGCQKDVVLNQVPQETPVAFGTYLGRDAQTKATVMDLTKLKEANYGFGVYAYYTGDNDYVASNTTGSSLNFMNDQYVEYTTTTTPESWNYTPMKYWPKSTTDKFTFFAYAPKKSSNIYDRPGNGLKGDPSFGFTVDETILNQTDLLFAANNHTNYTRSSGTTVSFNFKHALSRIGFKAISNVETGSTVTINSIVINGSFYKNGIINLNGGSWNTTSSTISSSYTLSSSDFHNTTIANNVVDLHKAGGAVTPVPADKGYLMIIPKSFTGENKISIAVNYTITTNDTALNGGKVQVTNSITSAPFNINFEQGKAYTFYLNIGLDAVAFSASVANWITDLDGDKNDDDDITVTI